MGDIEQEILKPSKTVEDPPDFENIRNYQCVMFLYKVAKRMGIIKKKINGGFTMVDKEVEAAICERKTKKYKKWIKNYGDYAEERREIYQKYLEAKKGLMKRDMIYYGRKEFYEKIKSVL
jgi:hypothetical protein